MNFISGRLLSNGANSQFKSHGVDLIVSGVVSQKGGQDCVLGIRPEELKTVATLDASITGIIDVVEPTGPDTMVTAIIGEQVVVARAEARFNGRRGDTIGFRVDPQSINLFDKETETRIATGA